MANGLDGADILKEIVANNLYQYPTERTIRQIANGCIARLRALNDTDLITAIANHDVETSKQICLYAMMKQYRLVWDFMITVIGAKYRQQDFSFSRRDINVFFLQLQEQDDLVSSWTENTIKKIGSVLMRILIENGYVKDNKSTTLNPVILTRLLENAIRSAGDDAALAAFNCFV